MRLGGVDKSQLHLVLYRHLILVLLALHPFRLSRTMSAAVKSHASAPLHEDRHPHTPSTPRLASPPPPKPAATPVKEESPTKPVAKPVTEPLTPPKSPAKDKTEDPEDSEDSEEVIMRSAIAHVRDWPWLRFGVNRFTDAAV